MSDEEPKLAYMAQSELDEMAFEKLRTDSAIMVGSWSRVGLSPLVWLEQLKRWLKFDDIRFDDPIHLSLIIKGRVTAYPGQWISVDTTSAGQRMLYISDHITANIVSMDH